MSLSRRAFLKSTAAIAVASGGLKLFGLNEVFAADTVLIPHASHYGPFKAVVKNGVLIGVQPLPGFDPMPTQMLLEGVLTRTYHPTRVMYPMVRRSYLANPRGDTKPHLRGKEPFVRVSWEDALALVADATVWSLFWGLQVAVLLRMYHAMFGRAPDEDGLNFWLERHEDGVSLGAIVHAFDVRPEVAEQIESMGANFVYLEFDASELPDGAATGGYAAPSSPEFREAQLKKFRELAPDIDIVITTALIPGRDAPKLWLADMVAAMKPGSVVVDLAAERGGNCDLTVADQKIVSENGVTIVGYTDFPSRMAARPMRSSDPMCSAR